MYFEYWPESGCLSAEFVFCKISHITPGGAGERRRAGAESLASLVLITTTCTLVTRCRHCDMPRLKSLFEETATGSLSRSLSCQAN